MQRRSFIQLAITTGATVVVPATWYRITLANKERARLAIPTILEPNNAGKIELILQTGSVKILNGKKTKTYGINGNFLGPAIKTYQGQKFNIKVINNLPVRTIIHYHGLSIPGAVDGGPTKLIDPGKMTEHPYEIKQQAATCWLHSHPCGYTGYQTAMGLAGLFLIEDENSRELLLPNRWGIDDIPLIMQDKRFLPNGQIAYRLNEVTAGVGWIGTHMLVNGGMYPKQQVPRGWIRLRLLNGCNARGLMLQASDKRDFLVIASDGGFLNEPVAVNQLEILMGERFEVLLNTADGKPFDLVLLPTNQFGMSHAPFDKILPILTIEPTQDKGITNFSYQLNNMKAPQVPENIKVRRFNLMMDSIAHMAHERIKKDARLIDQHSSLSVHALHALNKINNKSFNKYKPLFDVKQGVYEKWIISGAMDTMLHPFHVHGTQFRILTENGKAPLAHRTGWKDTVKVEGLRSEILVKFDELASSDTPYMAHCHLLEHEDTGMMFGFTVSK